MGDLTDVRRAYGDTAANRRELHRILDEVPEYLLEPLRVAFDMVLACVEMCLDLQRPGCHLVLVDRKDFAQHGMCIHGLAPELELAFRNARKIEQIVDESGFELDVAPNDFEPGPEIIRALRQLVRL